MSHQHKCEHKTSVWCNHNCLFNKITNKLAIGLPLMNCDLLKLCQCGVVLHLPINSLLQLIPQLFDSVQVQWTGTPLHDWNSILCQMIHHSSCCVGSWIMLIIHWIVMHLRGYIDGKSAVPYFPPFWVVTCPLWPITGPPTWVFTPTGPPMSKTSAKPITRPVAVEQSTCINCFLF